MTFDNKFIKEMGARIKQLRLDRGMSRRQLVDELIEKYNLPLDERTIMRIENGDNPPKIDNLLYLSEALGSTLDYIVFGREVSDDNSYTLSDNLKRLNRLIYSLFLIPQKDENPNSPYYGRYYFMCYEDAVSVYMSRIESFSYDKNYDFEYLGKDPFFTVQEYDKKIGSFYGKEEQMFPSLKRMKEIHIKSGQDPDLKMAEKIAEIERHRKK